MSINIIDLKQKFDSADWMTQSALIEFENERGIALLNSQARYAESPYDSIVVFWESGEVTECPEQFELVKWNAWR